MLSRSATTQPVCKVLASPTFVPATKPNHDYANNSERAEVTSKCNEYSMDDGTDPSAPVGGSAMGVPSTYPSFRAGRPARSGPFKFVILSVYQEWSWTSFSDHRLMILAILRVISFRLGRTVDGGEERTNSIRTVRRGTQRVNTGASFGGAAQCQRPSISMR